MDERSGEEKIEKEEGTGEGKEGKKGERRRKRGEERREHLCVFCDEL